MTLSNLTEKIIRLLKNDNSYQITSQLTNRQLAEIMRIRSGQFSRGLWKKFTFKKICGVCFIGKHTRIEHGYNISAESGLIIEDHVHIDALSTNGIQLGSNVTIGRFSTLVCSGVISRTGCGIKIGNNSSIGAKSFLGGQGGIEIGSDVIIGPGVHIFSENHIFSQPDIPIRKQGERRKGVKIGNDCWLGAGVTILDDVTIGNGCVVAAGSVVTKSAKENHILMGVPAKSVKKRC